MANRKSYRPHILKHTASGKWLEHWIDGWHLTDKMDEATMFHDERSSSKELLPMLAQFFGNGQIEVVFLDAIKKGNAQTMPTGLQSVAA